jgi:hypothetical protein
MTKEESFSTITITKKQKMPIHLPPMLRLEVGGFSAKKDKSKSSSSMDWLHFLI